MVVSMLCWPGLASVKTSGRFPVPVEMDIGRLVESGNHFFFDELKPHADYAR